MSTKEFKEQSRLNNISRKYVNNGTITKFVKPEELKNYLKDGWILGWDKKTLKRMGNKIRNKNKERTKTKKIMNNGKECKFIELKLINKYLKIGWELGHLHKETKNQIEQK